MSYSSKRNGHGHAGDELAETLQAVVRDAEGLLKETATQTEHKVQEARLRASKSLHQARERLHEVEEEVLDGARELVGDAEKYTRRNPWRAVSVAAAAGLVVGVLLGRN